MHCMGIIIIIMCELFAPFQIKIVSRPVGT